MTDAPVATYLDHAASTVVRPEAVEAMVPWLADHHGNPSGNHAAARRARRAVDDARDAVAALVGCPPGEVVFTSGGTEADATALVGAATARPGPLLVGAIDHHAVLDGARVAARLAGTTCATLPVDGRGQLDLAALADALDRAPAGPDGPPIVSVALANNEVGTVQPLAPVAAVLDDHAPGAVLHTDAVQAAAWLDLPRRAAPAALVALSAHKLGGPKGVGALAVRAGTPLAPLLAGGGQERGRRSGTPNVAGIVGFGVAARLLVEDRAERCGRVAALRDRLAAGLLPALRDLAPGAAETVVGGDGDRSHVLPGHLHLTLPGVAGDELLFLLDQQGLAASAGASCASGALEPSHVMAGLGRPAGGTLRLTLGWSSTEADVDRALRIVPAAVAAVAGRAGPPSSGAVA